MTAGELLLILVGALGAGLVFGALAVWIAWKRTFRG